MIPFRQILLLTIRRGRCENWRYGPAGTGRQCGRDGCSVTAGKLCDWLVFRLICNPRQKVESFTLIGPKNIIPIETGGGLASRCSAAVVEAFRVREDASYVMLAVV
jgi:hypothetical protein